MQSNKRLLYLGLALAWVPLLGLYLPITFNMFRGITENKATGLAAVAGAWTESLLTFGLVAFVAAELAAIVVLVRALRRKTDGALGCAPSVFSGLTMACAALGLGLAVMAVVWMMRGPSVR